MPKPEQPDLLGDELPLLTHTRLLHVIRAYWEKEGLRFPRERFWGVCAGISHAHLNALFCDAFSGNSAESLNFYERLDIIASYGGDPAQLFADIDQARLRVKQDKGALRETDWTMLEIAAFFETVISQQWLGNQDYIRDYALTAPQQLKDRQFSPVCANEDFLMLTPNEMFLYLRYLASLFQRYSSTVCCILIQTISHKMTLHWEGDSWSFFDVDQLCENGYRPRRCTNAWLVKNLVPQSMSGFIFNFIAVAPSAEFVEALREVPKPSLQHAVKRRADDGAFLLWFAARSNSLLLLSAFLRAGASLTDVCRNHTALSIAKVFGHLEAEKLLLEAAAQQLDSSLETQDFDQLAHLLASGVALQLASVRVMPCFLQAISQGHEACVVALLLADPRLATKRRKIDQMTPLHLAARQGDVAITRRLYLALSAQQSAQAHRLLRRSIRQGESSVVFTLLRAGVSPNTLDRNGVPPLVYAALHAHRESALALIIAGAQIESFEWPVTPLFAVIASQRTLAEKKQMIQLLLVCGATVDAAVYEFFQESDEGTKTLFGDMQQTSENIQVVREQFLEKKVVYERFCEKNEAALAKTLALIQDYLNPGGPRFMGSDIWKLLVYGREARQLWRDIFDMKADYSACVFRVVQEISSLCLEKPLSNLASDSYLTRLYTSLFYLLNEPDYMLEPVVSPLALCSTESYLFEEEQTPEEMLKSVV